MPFKIIYSKYPKIEITTESAGAVREIKVNDKSPFFYTCEYCQDEFGTFRKPTKRAYCSEKCEKALNKKKYMARQKLMPIPAEWEAIKKYIWDRDNETCQGCKKIFTNTESKFHVHHIFPLADGGSNEIHNLVLLCAVCHKFAHSRIESRKQAINH